MATPKSEVTMQTVARRARVIQTIAIIGMVGAVALAIELVPLGLAGVWLGIAVTVGVTTLASVLLARAGQVDLAGWVLVVGLTAALMLGPIATRTLGTTPFWLGPLGAIGLIVLRRSALWVLVGGTVVLLALMAILAPRDTFAALTNFDIMLAGTLVSVTTAVIAVYGILERERTLRAASTMAVTADELLRERERVRAELESRVAAREKSLAEVLADQESLIVTLTDLAVRDPRTGLFNARHHKRHWSLMVEESRKSGLPISVIALDMDNFGRINRAYSHAVGDAVLEDFAGVIRRLIRPGDIPYRLGQGEEFLVLLPHTRQDEAVQVAERIRVACRKRAWPALAEDERLTVSAGVTERPPDSDDRWADVLHRADDALRQSKLDGRDRLTVAPTAGPEA